MYGIGFTARSLARVVAKDGMSRLVIRVGSNKELMEVGRMAEGD